MMCLLIQVMCNTNEVLGYKYVLGNTSDVLGNTNDVLGNTYDMLGNTNDVLGNTNECAW